MTEEHPFDTGVYSLSDMFETRYSTAYTEIILGRYEVQVDRAELYGRIQYSITLYDPEFRNGSGQKYRRQIGHKPRPSWDGHLTKGDVPEEVTKAFAEACRRIEANDFMICVGVLHE